MPYKNPEDRRENLRRRNALLREVDPTAYSENKKKAQIRSAESYERNKEQVTKDHEKWRAEHPGYFTEQNHKNGRNKTWEQYQEDCLKKRKAKAEYMKEWGKTEKGQRFRTARELKKKFELYGLTIEQYEDKWLEQDGKCAMCKKECPVYGQYRIHIDHDHNTGKVRDLLCGNCNSGIGQLRESEELLQKAIEYLRKHGA